MTRNLLTSALITLALLAASSVAYANQPAVLGKWWRAPKVAQALQITSEESRRLDEMSLKMGQERIQKRSELQQARLLLDSLFDQEPLDQAAVQKQFERLAKAQSELAMVQSRFLLEVRKLLGRDRWQQLRQEFRKFRQHRQERPRAPRY